MYSSPFKMTRTELNNGVRLCFIWWKMMASFVTKCVKIFGNYFSQQFAQSIPWHMGMEKQFQLRRLVSIVSVVHRDLLALLLVANIALDAKPSKGRTNAVQNINVVSTNLYKLSKLVWHLQDFLSKCRWNKQSITNCIKDSAMKWVIP